MSLPGSRVGRLDLQPVWGRAIFSVISKKTTMNNKCRDLYILYTSGINCMWFKEKEKWLEIESWRC